jgi:RHS repeat-associated protein
MRLLTSAHPIGAPYRVADASRASDATYSLTDDMGTDIRTVDQRGNNTWVTLGLKKKDYTFSWPGYNVTLNSSALGTVSADAVRILPAVFTTNVNYVFADHLNTPRVITRASDNKIVWRWDQADPYGVKQPNENPNALGTFTYNPRFPGQLYDPETGLYYNMARYYDPKTGTYIQSDPIGLAGGVNTYAYVRNNPLRYIDPFGLINLQIPETSGETGVHANPGPDVVPPGAMSEHEPAHVHLGDNNGPRVRTDTWEPYSAEDERRMSRKQIKFCKNLTDAQKSLITQRQLNVYKYGRRLLTLMATPAIALDSLTASCKQDPIFCMDTFPEAFDRFEPSQCNNNCQ